MPKINIRLKKQAIKLHLVRSVHLDARMIPPQCVIHDFGCSVHLDARMIPPQCVIHDFGCSVHLDARKIPPQCVIHDFGCSVHLDARKNHALNVFISCVACILMHDRFPSRAFFIRATSCTLRVYIMRTHYYNDAQRVRDMYMKEELEK